MSYGDIARGTLRAIWRHMPRRLQGVLFSGFSYAMRKRKILAEVDGLRFALDLGEGIDLQVYLGSFERDVVRAIEVLCEPGSCAVDVGANIGAHTIRMSRRVAARGRVIAFEPTVFAYTKLLKNISLNQADNVTPVMAAASDRDRDLEEISVRSRWPTHGSAELDIASVPLWCLDHWLDRHGIDQVRLMKVDVDGEEAAVLRGGGNMIKRSLPVIILEIGAYHFERSDSNPVAFLAATGYRFWDLSTLVEYPDEGAIRSRLPEHDPDKELSVNLLCATHIHAIADLRAYTGRHALVSGPSA